MTTAEWRTWAPGVTFGAIVTFLGLFEVSAARSMVWSRASQVLVAFGMGAAVALCRRRPAVALALVWVTFGMQLLTSVPLMLVQVFVTVVAFGTARWGRTSTLWVSAMSVPTGVLLVILDALVLDASLVELSKTRYLLLLLDELGLSLPAAAMTFGMAVLGIPWLAGLAFRFGDRARASQLSQVAAEERAARAVRETEQAREIARLRAEQARLARDVHDVVGHSLAVILAQAESAQYIEDDNPQALKVTMANIATAARASLQDVRQVLSDTRQRGTVPGGLDKLVEGVRMSGHEVVVSEVGTPQPLPPELEVVAFRVLQEMLTNALKYGRRDEPVRIERRWANDLRMEVRNVIGTEGGIGADGASSAADVETAVGVAVVDGEARPVGGRGLDGMRRRLQAVGGWFDAQRQDGPGGPTFVATAWVPVRAGER